MRDTRIAFIGAGNMARSLIGGLIADGWNPDSISVADPDRTQLASLRNSFSVHVDTDNNKVAATGDVLVLAVKPQVIRSVASDLAATLKRHQPLVISIAAGIRIVDIQRWFDGKIALVRCMPNTPALVQSGATALIANSFVSNDQKNLAETILRAVGLTLWIDNEDLMDVVTAISGSGPAYFFLIIEALQETGEKLGLTEKAARLLAVQTAFGAAKMALESSEDAATLRKRVTSPGGTTETALSVLEDGHIRSLFEKALTAARDRSKELAKHYGAE